MGIDVGELLLNTPPFWSLQGSRMERCQERTMRRENYYSWGPPEALSCHFRIPNLALYVHSHPPSSLLPPLLPHGSAIGVLLSAPGSVHPCKGSSWVGIEVLSPDTQTQFPTTLPLEPYQMTCSLGNPHSVIDTCPSFPVTFNSPLPQHTSNSEKKKKTY